jgi:hypothetical protein
MPSWKDEINLICLVIDCMGPKVRMNPPKFLNMYHINP